MVTQRDIECAKKLQHLLSDPARIGFAEVDAHNAATIAAHVAQETKVLREALEEMYHLANAYGPTPSPKGEDDMLGRARAALAAGGKNE